MRHFLKFIDAYEKWDAHGFNIKVRSKANTPAVRIFCKNLSADTRAERRSLPSQLVQT
jgi:hypothetical protein